MLIVFLTCFEVIFQMILSIGIYIYIYEDECKRKEPNRLFLLVLIVIFIMEVYNNLLMLVSTDGMLFFTILESIWLLIWTKKRFSTVFIWNFFENSTIFLMKMPAVILQGILSEGGLIAVNYRPNLCGVIIKVLTLFCVMLLTLYIVKRIKLILKKILNNGNIFFFSFGLIEYCLAVYLLRLVWIDFNSTILLLNLFIICCIVLCMISIFIWIQFKNKERQYELNILKEKMLQANYVRILEEQVRNKKINHDYKFILAYLYNCIEQKEYEKGMKFIQDKLEHHKLKQVEVWTGNECVDYLICDGEIRAKERDINFIVDVEITEVPIAEYDFFVILGNLLDNAFEAASLCNNQKGYVKLTIKTINNMLLLYIENNYIVEPKKTKNRFLSMKGGGHGWGIINAKELVEQHDGIIKIDYKKGIFTVQIMITEEENDAEI